MTERKLEALRPRPRRGSDVLLAWSSAEEHDHIALYEISESGAREAAKSKRRTVYAPPRASPRRAGRPRPQRWCGPCGAPRSAQRPSPTTTEGAADAATAGACVEG